MLPDLAQMINTNLDIVTLMKSGDESNFLIIGYVNQHNTDFLR